MMSPAGQGLFLSDLRRQLMNKSGAGWTKRRRLMGEAHLVGGAFWGLLRFSPVELSLAAALTAAIIAALVAWLRR